MRYLCFLFCVLAISACRTIVPPCRPVTQKDVVYVVEQGWHAEIGIPVEELGKDLAFYRQIFHGARVLMFGYGKRTFFTAPPGTLSEYFLGPLPGPAVIHVVGIRVTPIEAYPPEDTVTLLLPKGGSEALSTYIWNDLIKDHSGQPQFVARSTEPDGLFYAAQSPYNLFHTCNTWTADALQQAGFAITGEDVTFSGQVMDQVNSVVKSQCPF